MTVDEFIDGLAALPDRAVADVEPLRTARGARCPLAEMCRHRGAGEHSNLQFMAAAHAIGLSREDALRIQQAADFPEPVRGPGPTAALRRRIKRAWQAAS